MNRNAFLPSHCHFLKGLWGSATSAFISTWCVPEAASLTQS